MQITPLKFHTKIQFQAKNTQEKKTNQQRNIDLNNLSPYFAYQKAMLLKTDRIEAREGINIVGKNYKNASSKIKVNPNFIELAKHPPKIKTYDNFDKVIEHSKLGEIFECENKLYYRNQNDITLIKLSKETFEYLFPTLETFALVQGDLGNCYFIAAVFDFLNNPNTRGVIFSMFEEKDDNIIITIPDSKDCPITLPKNYKNKTSEHTFASIGIQMLERAYQLTRCHKYGIIDDSSMIETGSQFLVYNAFLNSKNTQAYIEKSENTQNRTEEEILQDIKFHEIEIQLLQKALQNKKFRESLHYISENEVKYNLRNQLSKLRCAYEDFDTTNNEHRVTSDELLDLIIKHANNPNYLIALTSKFKDETGNQEKLIVPYHAYSIIGLNEENQTMDIVNPWNTSAYTTITFDEFKKYFGTISIAKIS